MPHIKPRCVWFTPFGVPVEPPVKISSARSSAFGNVARSSASEASRRHASSVVPPRPSVSCVRMPNSFATKAAFSAVPASPITAHASTSTSCF